MAGLRAEQKARTRARVLEAARACFEAEGYEATTIARVAALAKVAAGTVMAHFPDKRALVAAAFHDIIQEVLDEAIAAAPEGAAIERLLFVSEQLYRYYARNRALSVALVREATFPDPEARPTLTAQLEGYLDWVRAELRAGHARGELRAGLDLEIATLGYWADYFMVLLMGLMGGRAVDAQRQALAGLLAARMLDLAPSPSARID